MGECYNCGAKLAGDGRPPREGEIELPPEPSATPIAFTPPAKVELQVRLTPLAHVESALEQSVSQTLIALVHGLRHLQSRRRLRAAATVPCGENGATLLDVAQWLEYEILGRLGLRLY